MTDAVPLVTFILGFAGGAAAAELRVLYRRRRPDDAPNRGSKFTQNLLGLAMLLAVGYTVFATNAQTAEQARIAVCQTQINDENAAGRAALSAAASRENRAADRFLAAQAEFLGRLDDRDARPEDRAAAYAVYLRAIDANRAALADVERVRAENPARTSARCEP